MSKLFMRKAQTMLIALALSGTVTVHAKDYDVVLKGGRVMDPETSLDAVMNVGIKNGKIAAVTTDKLSGKEIINVKGLVVSPGFIDTHQHSFELPDGRLAAQDGTTTHMELEFGRSPVAQAYDIIEKRGGHPINYGFSSSWPMNRATVMKGFKGEATFSGLTQAFAGWGAEVSNPEQEKQILALIQKDLDDGAIAVGFPPAYGSGAGMKEAIKLWKKAAANNVPVSVHVRYQSMLDPNSSVEAMNEMLGLAASSGAHALLCHIQLVGLSDPYMMLDVIEAGRKSGLKLTTEVYPFGHTAPPISADYLKWENSDERIGFKWNEIRTVKKPHYTFKDKTDFQKHQKEHPLDFVQMEYIDESSPEGLAAMRAAVTFPETIPASDGTPIGWKGKPKDGDKLGLGSGVDVWPLPKDAGGQPRTTSTHAVILEKWVREQGALTLMQAIRNSTYVPAKALEQHIPQFTTKGRLQVGMDADITVFNPKTVKANANWDDVTALNDGFYHTLVNGVFVLKNGKIITDALPGQQIRRSPNSH
ncbi:MAG: amidohydrolase family protein [Gammaproteobacteria bacterium]|nr:amidohydrolase family protein [Gammaproteobacteria bacterium]